MHAQNVYDNDVFIEYKNSDEITVYKENNNNLILTDNNQNDDNNNEFYDCENNFSKSPFDLNIYVSKVVFLMMLIPSIPYECRNKLLELYVQPYYPSFKLS